MTTDAADREALKARLRAAEIEVQRAQNAAYYTHRHLLETRTPASAASYREALTRCQEAVDALVRADAALREAPQS